MEILFLIGRILFGGFFVLNGVNHFMKTGMMTGMAAAKGVPAPKLAVIGSGLVLLAAGAGIIFGVYPVTSLILVLVFLLPTTFTMHAFWRERDANLRMSEMINFMKNMAIIGATLMLMALSTNWALSLAL